MSKKTKCKSVCTVSRAILERAACLQNRVASLVGPKRADPTAPDGRAPGLRGTGRPGTFQKDGGRNLPSFWKASTISHNRVLVRSRERIVLVYTISLHSRELQTRGFTQAFCHHGNLGNRFWRSGRPRAAGKPFQKVGGEASRVSGRYPGRLGPPRPPKSTISGRSKNHTYKTALRVIRRLGEG